MSTWASAAATGVWEQPNADVAWAEGLVLVGGLPGSVLKGLSSPDGRPPGGGFRVPFHPSTCQRLTTGVQGHPFDFQPSWGDPYRFQRWASRWRIPLRIPLDACG